jgi:hypothetical protein
VFERRVSSESKSWSLIKIPFPPEIRKAFHFTCHHHADVEHTPMLPALIKRHAMIVLDLSSRKLQPELLPELQRELSVLKRNSIVRSRLKLSRSPSLCQDNSNNPGYSQLQMEKMERHRATSYFVNVTFGRLAQKLKIQREQRVTRNGRKLGIEFFYRLKRSTYIKRMLKTLLNRSAQGRMRRSWLRWNKILRRKHQYRRFAYSIIKTRRLYNIQKTTKKICYTIWKNYTLRLKQFRARCWQISMRAHNLCGALVGWRVYVVRTLKLRVFIMSCLASKLRRTFVAWLQQIQKQIKTRSRFLKKWTRKKEANAFRKWLSRTASAKVIANNLHRFFFGRRSRRRSIAQRQVILVNEKIRLQEEQNACRIAELRTSKLLRRSLSNTLRGRLLLHRVALLIQAQVKGVCDDQPFMLFLYQQCLRKYQLNEDELKQQMKRSVFDIFGKCNFLHTWSYDLARLTVLESNRKQVRQRVRDAFRKDVTCPRWSCPKCSESFALYGHLRLHTKQHLKRHCTWDLYAEEEEMVLMHTMILTKLVTLSCNRK